MWPASLLQVWAQKGVKTHSCLLHCPLSHSLSSSHISETRKEIPSNLIFFLIPAKPSDQAGIFPLLKNSVSWILQIQQLIRKRGGAERNLENLFPGQKVMTEAEYEFLNLSLHFFLTDFNPSPSYSPSTHPNPHRQIHGAHLSKAVYKTKQKERHIQNLKQ